VISAAQIARNVAALGFGNSRIAPIDSAMNDEVIDELRTQRVEGVAVSGVLDGSIEADAEFVERIIQRHDETMAQTLRVEIAAVRASEILAAAGISHRLLKGASLAHTIARNPSERSFRDVDVLVRGDSIDGAIDLFESKGAVRLHRQLRPGFDARFGKSVTMLLDDIEVDVHRLLCPGPFGVRMRPNELFFIDSTFELAGEQIPTLDPTDHLVHACYHAALGSAEPALVNLRDIALLAHGPFDEERFEDTIDRWRARAVIQRAVRLVERTISVELPEVLGRYRYTQVDKTERGWIDLYTVDDPRGRFAALAPATFHALRPIDRPAFARAVGFPDGVPPATRVRSILYRRK